MRLSLPDFALRRPITVVMVTISMVGLGAIAWHRTPIEFIPRMDLPFIGCFIPYPGATPEQVENEVAIPAEGEFRTISRMKSIITTSDSNGCSIRMNFDWETDMTLATAEVRDRMERLKLALPAEIDQLYLQRFSANQLPIMVFSMYRGEDDEEIAHLARTVLQPRLMRIEGVAEVRVFGRAEREVLVEFDQASLRTHNLGLYQLISVLQNSSLNVAAGDLTEGRMRYYVRVSNQFRRPEDIAELVVGPNGLRLKEVARVGYRTREEEGEFSIDGRGGAFIMVLKESEANTIRVCEAIKAELERVKQDPTFAGANYLVFMDQSEMILSTLNSLIQSGEVGGLLAIAVLFLFLWRIRPTIIVALAIPASLVVAMVYLYFAGMTLNVITMISLMIAIGMLVDNSIVVIENIFRHQQLGLDPPAAALKGAGEVAMAITASTLTTIVVFIPIFYMQTGQMASYMRQFAVPITVSLVASLVIALTLIPLAASRMKRYQSLAGAMSRAGQLLAGRSRLPAWLARALFSHPVYALRAGYVRCLGAAVRWRLATLVGIAALSGVTAYVARDIGRRDMPSVDTREVHIEAEFDQNYDLDMARQFMKALEAIVDRQREELGIKSVFMDYNPMGGTLRAYLYKPKDLAQGQTVPFTTQQVMDILWQRTPRYLPGAELRFSIAEAGDSATRQISVSMRGDDARLLEVYAQRFRALLEEFPGVSDVQTDAERARQEMQIRIDEVLAEREGITPLVLARTVDFALRGIRLPYLRQGGREIPVWAQFREEDRKRMANLDNVALLGDRGQLIPLRHLVTFEKAHSPQAIRRENGKNVVTLTAQTGEADMATVVANVRRLADAFELPRGYVIELGQEFEEMQTSLQNFIMALVLAVILIYVVMGSTFESYILPVSILGSVPLAFLGVAWAMYLTDTPMDVIAFIGVILMVGVVVNNGIVIVDHINQLRLAGMERYEAILQAGVNRFRPVMMTALTTILGCVPMATGGSVGMDVSFSSLGRALIGGLTTGTVLTLFVVPLFYSLIDDLRLWTMHFLYSLASVGRRHTPATAPD